MARTFSSSATVALLSQQCTQRFETIKIAISDASTHGSQFSLEGFTTNDFSDVFARFKIWTGNIGALQHGRASLDHRIQDTHVIVEVKRLLRQVALALLDLASIIDGDREQQTWYEGEGIASGYTDSDPDSDGDFDSKSAYSGGVPTPEEDDPRLVTESEQLMLMLGDLVKSLLKLSILIQKSSRRSKFARSSREKPYETESDILHVMASFPYAANNKVLLERLGKANAKRRQWLSYRRRHRDRLSSEGRSTSERTGAIRTNVAETSHDPMDDAFSESTFSLDHTADNSTTATTFYSREDDALHEPVNEESSEVSFSASTVSGREKSPLETLRLPPEAASGDPFECPYCFGIITISNLQSWIKHVHADLASYVCTFENCSAPLFENRLQWFDHELQNHRMVWNCSICNAQTKSMNDLRIHLRSLHASSLSADQAHAMARQGSAPPQRLPASSCPLCDYESTLRDRWASSNLPATITIKTEQLRSHLGRHLEQLALFILPKSALMHGNEDDDDGKSSDSGGTDSGEPEDNAVEPTLELDSDAYDVASILDSHIQSSPHILSRAPALALGWQPPHDFTPPTTYFETDDEDLVPRREESTFGGDLFTPGWVRGYGKKKEGYCARCEVGHWVNIPDGEYEFHLTYIHGLPRTGLPLPRPSEIRRVNSTSGSWEAYCDACSGWRLLKQTGRGWNWWRHCLTEHDAMTAAASAPETLDVSTSSAGDAGMRRAIANIRASKLEGFDATIKENPQLLHQTDGPSKTLLHFAAEVGRPDFVRHIVQALRNSNANQTLSDILNAQTKTGYTAMMLAVEQGNEDVVDYLLGEGARFDVVSLDGLNALDLAAHSGYASMATSLIWHGARVNESKTFRQVYLTSLSRPAARDAESQADQTDSSPGSTPLIRNELLEYASRNDVAEITECLARGVDLESTRPDGSTALMIAVSRNNIAAAELLLANGANLNAINSKGWTALMAAVRDANTAAVTFLLRHGADANHLSPDHWTALAEAAQSGHVELIDLLLAHGADTEARSSHDWTPLMHACYRGDKTSVNRLLRSGAQVENGSQRDETPMLLAAASGHVEIVQDLIAFGGSPDAKWASDEGLQGQGEIERTYQLGWTPLMVACQNGHEDVVRLLLGAGATRGARSPMSKNAVEIAKENGRSGILELLEQDVSGA